MKFIAGFSIIVMTAILAGCSHEKIVEKETKNVESAQIQTLPPIIADIPLNADIELQTSLQGIWKQYFIEDFNDSRSIDVMVFTNRQLKNKGFGCTDDHFGNTQDAKFRLGVCRINVPRNHSTGELKFSKVQRDSSHDFFKVLGQKELSLNTLVEYLKKSKRTPLLFVHGFNVKHEEAVLRAAQITYDLKYQGPVILFSWPAGSGDSFFDDQMIKKTYDENFKNAQNSIITFKLFVSKLIENNIAPNIIVHSMGHQVVLPALFELGKNMQATETPPQPMKPMQMPVGELILNAPDFDADVFIKNIDVIKNLSNRVTLYCSYNDKTMIVSKTVNSTSRLGACSYMEGVDTINVSLLDNPTFGLGHGYYSSRPILTDVFQVLLGIEASRRLFIRKSEPNSTEKYYLRQ